MIRGGQGTQRVLLVISGIVAGLRARFASQTQARLRRGCCRTRNQLRVAAVLETSLKPERPTANHDRHDQYRVSSTIHCARFRRVGWWVDTSPLGRDRAALLTHKLPILSGWPSLGSHRNFLQAGTNLFASRVPHQAAHLIPHSTVRGCFLDHPHN